MTLTNMLTTTFITILTNTLTTALATILTTTVTTCFHAPQTSRQFVQLYEQVCTLSFIIQIFNIHYFTHCYITQIVARCEYYLILYMIRVYCFSYN